MQGEFSHENDTLVYGGQKEKMSNSTTFKEHRTYSHSDTRTEVEFYFITRVCNDYVLDVLRQLEDSPPDILVINSALWDLHRYGRWAGEMYQDNVRRAASRLEDIMTEAYRKGSRRRLLVWSMSMPVSSRSRSGFVGADYEGTVGGGVVAANQTAKAVMRRHGAEVVDFYQLFEGQVHHRVKDGVHWDAVAHRRVTNYLLLLIANHLYGRDHLKSIKAKKILAGSPISDTPIAVPKRRPWLRSSPSSPSAFLFTPADSQCSKENDKNSDNRKDAPVYASPCLEHKDSDLRDKLTNNRLKRPRSPSPSPTYQTEPKRSRNNTKASKSYSNCKSPAVRVVSYIKRGWQRVKGFFGHRPRHMPVHQPQRKFPNSYYNNWQSGSHNRGYYHYYDYGHYY